MSYNCWNVVRQVTPAAELHLVIPPAEEPPNHGGLHTEGAITYATALTASLCATTAKTTIPFEVTCPPEKVISSIRIDGQAFPPNPGHVVVARNNQISHVLQVTYQDANN